jgi:hypothetical protein
MAVDPSILLGLRPTTFIQSPEQRLQTQSALESNRSVDETEEG